MSQKTIQMEDLGLQAISEKMNSFITPLISGSFWDISNIFQIFLIFSQSLSRQKNSIESDFTKPSEDFENLEFRREKYS